MHARTPTDTQVDAHVHIDAHAQDKKLQFFDQGQTTTLGATFPTLCEKCEGSLTSPTNQYGGDAGDTAYGFIEKTRISNHL